MFASFVSLVFPSFVFASPLDAHTIIQFTNEQRELHGLPALFENQLLALAAKNHAQDMAKQQYFAHTNTQDKRFSSWIRDTGYSYTHVGENLAMDFVTSEGVLDGWMESESHRANLLHESYTEIGIAVQESIINNRQTVVVVQIFGTPVRSIAPRVLGASTAAITQAAKSEISTKSVLKALPHNTPKLQTLTMLTYLQHIMLNPHEKPPQTHPTMPIATVQGQEGFDRRRKSSADNGS